MGEGLKRAFAAARATRASPAGPGHQVVQITGGKSAYRKTVCDECPWRVDRAGAFPAEAFRISAPTAYDASVETFACHMAGKEKPVICAGFLLRNSINNLGARFKRIAGGPGCSADTELHASYRAMAIANGVPPDDPALARCRADDE